MRCSSTDVLPDPAMPSTKSTGTSSWRTTRFCSRWMVAVMACSFCEWWRFSAPRSSESSIATVVSKYAFRWSRVMSNCRRSSRFTVRTRPSTLYEVGPISWL